MKKIFCKMKYFIKKKEGIYFLLASFFGLAMVFINPPFTGVPDEHVHYLKASAIASGFWRCSGNDQISQSNFDLANKVKPVDVAGLKEQKVPLSVLKKEFFASSDLSKKNIGNLMCGSSTIAYIPQASGIFLGEKIGLSSLASFYLARILSLFLAIFITFLAIKFLPFGKNVLLVFALLPMTVQQYASLNYDVLHISLAFLFLAFVLKIAFESENKIGFRDVVWLFILAFLGLNIKGAFLLSFLVFLLPEKKFLNWKINWIVKILIIFAGISGFFVNRLFFFDSFNSFPNNVNPAEQIHYVFQHPLFFLNAVFLTFYDKLGFLFETFLIKPGWLRFSLPYLFYIFLILGIILLIKNTNEEERNLIKLRGWQRVWLFGVFLFNFILVFLALYLGWSRVGAEKINGIQGRYFIPYVPLLVFSFYGAKIDFRFNLLKKYNNFFLLLFYSLIFFWFFWFIFGYYYRTNFSFKKIFSEKILTTQEVKKAEILTFRNEVKQKFFQEKKDLTGIKVYFSKKILSGKYVFSIRDKNCQEVIREKIFETEGRELSSIEWKFALIQKREKDNEFCFALSRVDGNFNDVKVMPLNEKRVEPLILDESKKDVSLLFDLIYKN